ncbi:LIN54 [Bugula neritina]|uniref:LIN54 n=1 Tax=Bugula neritina TaxID=10212 RepID=A0A7J7KR82_BUGNE|nr:LIN54 [Bugula neritina]
MLTLLPSNQTVMQRAPVVKQVYPGITQQQQQLQQHILHTTDAGHHESAILEPALSNFPPAGHIATTTQAAPDTSKLKKPCNCTKSQCLKLYCDCFANGEFCSNCNCQNCFNNLEHEDERQKAVKQCLERNPQAFHPKIGKGAKADARRHQKGCNCKRSGCLKNYCECYEAKIPCGSICKCVGCKNSEGVDGHRSLMSLADAADLRHSQLNTASSKSLYEQKSRTPLSLSPHHFLKKCTIEAIANCLILQCKEAETAKCNDSTTEKVILEEFGRCLSELIHVSSSMK